MGRALDRCLREIREARQRLRDVVRETPVVPCRSFSEVCEGRVLLKLESFQRTGSFKIRGALAKLTRLTALPASRAPRGVVAASAGNHAQGVALAAAITGVSACIVMAKSTPEAKIGATRDYGAEVILHGASYEDAVRHARDLAATRGHAFVHPFDDLDVISGQGTVGLEILEQAGRPDVVLVPIGGGGLISGIALALRALAPEVRIVGVQAAGVNPFERSFREGRLVEVDASATTFAEGIRCRRPGRLTWRIVRSLVDDVVSVTDEEMATAISLLLERSKVVAEAAGAATTAAILAGKAGDLRGKTVLALVSGGNLDVRFLRPTNGAPAPLRASLLVEMGGQEPAGGGGRSGGAERIHVPLPRPQAENLPV